MSIGKFFKVLGKVAAAAATASPARKNTQPQALRATGAIPVMTSGMLLPEDKVLTKADAINMYKAFVLQVGFYDKSDLYEAASEFEDQMDIDEQALKDAVDERKYEHEEAKNDAEIEVNELDDEELDAATIKAEKARIKQAVTQAKADVAHARQQLANFKANRRGYLLAYVNFEIHGTTPAADSPFQPGSNR